MAAGRCQSPRPEPSPEKRSRARVLRLPPRLLVPVQLGELVRAPPPPPPLLPTPPRRRRCRSRRRPPGRGGRENRARGGGGGGEVMLAPGIRAAAAEQRHLRDPGCSVPVARGPDERRETARPSGKIRPGGALAAPGPPLLSPGLTRLVVPGASWQGCLGRGPRVRTHGQAEAGAGATPARAFRPRRWRTLIARGWHCVCPCVCGRAAWGTSRGPRWVPPDGSPRPSGLQAGMERIGLPPSSAGGRARGTHEEVRGGS